MDGEDVVVLALLGSLDEDEGGMVKSGGDGDVLAGYVVTGGDSVLLVHERR